jgi:hypothetical protein
MAMFIGRALQIWRAACRDTGRYWWIEFHLYRTSKVSGKRPTFRGANRRPRIDNHGWILDRNAGGRYAELTAGGQLAGSKESI